jgi:gluconate 5-dehydrogenase
VAEPADVVGATLLFCSPAAAFITGQVLYVDGGLTATQ